MQSHSVHKGINPHCFFILELLKKHIQGNDGAGPPNSSTGTQKGVQSQVRCTLSALSIGKAAVWSVYLQWTTVGDDVPDVCICSLTSPLNWIRTCVFSGTPWSGQTVKWKCFTLHSSEVCLCEHTVLQTQLHLPFFFVLFCFFLHEIDVFRHLNAFSYMFYCQFSQSPAGLLLLGFCGDQQLSVQVRLVHCRPVSFTLNLEKENMMD